MHVSDGLLLLLKLLLLLLRIVHIAIVERRHVKIMMVVVKERTGGWRIRGSGCRVRTRGLQLGRVWCGSEEVVHVKRRV